jgi:hypothetical protein
MSGTQGGSRVNHRNLPCMNYFFAFNLPRKPPASPCKLLFTAHDDEFDKHFAYHHSLLLPQYKLLATVCAIY